MVAIYGWYIPAVVYGLIGVLTAIIIRKKDPVYWRLLIESNLILTKRMVKYRPWRMIGPWYAHQWQVYLLPWLFAAVWFCPDIVYWIPAIAFMVGQVFGKAIKPVHVLVLAPWIAMSGISWQIVLALVLIDFISAGFYTGDLWWRFYYGLRATNDSTREAGEWLRDKSGRVWSNHYHHGTYLHSRKRPQYGMVPALEVWGVAWERRSATIQRLQDDPPTWIVTGKDFNAMNITSPVHERVINFGEITIWKIKE
jgi:hypothetical protein